MRLVIAAAFALTAASSLHAQTTGDFNTATPLPGNWSWTQAADGSVASYADSSGRPQLTIRCTRSTRTVTIARPAAAAAASFNVWTSSQSRNLAASFDPATAQLSGAVTAFDPLLDALSTSRGRIAVSVSGTPALVAPAWAEVARVVEDCRV